MGYTRVIQSGDYTEIYQYEKNYVRPRERHTTNLQRKRRRDSKSTTVCARSNFSVQRAKASFYRLVASNLEANKVPAFLTFTNFQEVSLVLGYYFLKVFWERLKKHEPNIKYILVPEWQPKSGFLHYHAIVWGLSEETIKNERSRRNLQRLYNRGYLDVRPAYDASTKIATYMAKYMAKTMRDPRLGKQRSYTCSRNIKRPYTAGSNTLSEYLDELVPVDNHMEKLAQYDTLWLGTCIYKRYHKLN